jgi:hypothetical protein
MLTSPSLVPVAEGGIVPFVIIMKNIRLGASEGLREQLFRKASVET